MMMEVYGGGVPRVVHMITVTHDMVRAQCVVMPVQVPVQDPA